MLSSSVCVARRGAQHAEQCLSYGRELADAQSGPAAGGGWRLWLPRAPGSGSRTLLSGGLPRGAASRHCRELLVRGLAPGVQPPPGEAGAGGAAALEHVLRARCWVTCF